MLLLDYGPVYLKFLFSSKLVGTLTPTENFLDILLTLQSKLGQLEFIDLKLTKTIGENTLYFFKVNKHKINNFNESVELLLIREQIKLANISEIYYCGKPQGKDSELITLLFPDLNEIKQGKNTQLSVIGVDFLNKNFDKPFFCLPYQTISDLVKIGKFNYDHTIDSKIYLEDSSIFPLLIANIIEGVSIYKVESISDYSRVGGCSFGATTYWSLLQLTCGYTDPLEAVKDAIEGQNELIDLSVKDIFGQGYDLFGLPPDLIASSFGKLKYLKDMSNVEKKDISRSLLTLMCVTLSQTIAFTAINENIRKVLVTGNPFECLEFMQMVMISIQYFSNKGVSAYFTDYSAYLNLLGQFKSREMLNSESKGDNEIEIIIKADN